MKNKNLYLFLVAFPLMLSGCGGTTPTPTPDPTPEPEHVHDYGTLHQEVAATCEESGSIAYYYCEGCSKYFDENKNEISQTDLVIKALGHDYGSLHSGHDATCEETGNEAYYECSRCHQLFDVDKNKVTEDDLVIDARGHNYGELHQKVDPTCEDNGHEAYYLCEACGTYFTSDKVKTLFSDLIIPAKGHDYGELVAKVDATCEDSGHEAYYYCKDCGTYFTQQKVATNLQDLIIPAKDHDVSSEWSSDETSHWHQCTRCDHKEDEAEHSSEQKYDNTDHWCECSECHYVTKAKESHTLGNWFIDAENEERIRTCSDCEYKEIDEDADVRAFEIGSLGFTASSAIQFNYKMTLPDWESGACLNLDNVSIKLNGEDKDVTSIQYFSDSNTFSVNLGFNGIKGDLFVIEGGSTFNEGSIYRVLKKNLACSFDGNAWKFVNVVADEFEYSWGANNVIMFTDPLGRTGLTDPQTLYIDNSLYTASVNGKVITNIQGFYTPGKSSEEIESNDIYKLHFQGFTALEDGDVLTFYKGSMFVANEVVYLSNDIAFKWDNENSVWAVTDPIAVTVDPYLTITGVSYGTSKLLQVSYEANCGTASKEIKSDFSTTTEGFVVDQAGSSQNVWYTSKNTGFYKMTYNFESDFIAGQYYIIGAGTKYVLEDDTVVSITKALKFTFDGNSWSMDEYIAENLISFTPGYATGDLIQVNTGIVNEDEKPSANFLISDFSISWYGDATVAWVTVNSATIWTFNFTNSAEGQYIVIEKGSKFTMATGHEYSLDANYMFVRDETSWVGRKMNDKELVFKFVSYSAANANQVITNSVLDTKGADTSAGSNGIISLKHSNDTVLWGYYGSGIHPSYNTMYITFNFNNACEEGAIMTIDKGTTLKLSDDSIVETGVNFKFTFTAGNWKMTVSV